MSVRRGICKHTRARARTPGAALLNPPVHSSSLRAPLASADRSVRVRAAFIAACVLCTVAGLLSNSSSAQRPQQQGSSCRRWMDYLLIHLPRVALRGHLLVSAPFCDFYAHRDCDHWSCTDLRAALTSESPRCCWCCWVDAQLISRRGAFCNKLLQTLWGAKSWCQHRLGFLWHCENFLFIHPLPRFCFRCLAAGSCFLGKLSTFPFSIMFTFAAFCYMLSLVLCVSLIFFAIWHVSTLHWVSLDVFFWGGGGGALLTRCWWQGVWVYTELAGVRNSASWL